MSNNHHEWNQITNTGNPTRTKCILNLIKSVKKKETRNQGIPTQARRPLTLSPNKPRKAIRSYLKKQQHSQTQNRMNSEVLHLWRKRTITIWSELEYQHWWASRHQWYHELMMQQQNSGRKNIIYNMNIYFKVVEVQIQALECIPKLGRDSSHPGAVLKAPHPIEPVMTSERWTWNTLRERDGGLSLVWLVTLEFEF